MDVERENKLYWKMFECTSVFMFSTLCREKLEKEMNKTREEMEKDIERKLKTKQLQDSLAAQQQKFDDATRRLEEEERKRRLEYGKEAELDKISSLFSEVKRENEGLKMKISALEENNNLLKQMKQESQGEIDRLRRTMEDLRTTILEKSQREPVAATQPPPPQQRPEYPIIMPITLPETRRDPTPVPPAQPIPSPQPPVTVNVQQPQQNEREKVSAKSDEFEGEKRRLEELRRGLEKQERVRNVAKIFSKKARFRNHILSRQHLKKRSKEYIPTFQNA